MDRIGTTEDGRTIAALTTVETNLLSAIVPMLEVTQPAQKVTPVNKVKRAKKPASASAPRGKRVRKVAGDSPLHDRIARKLELFSRPMPVKEIAAELGVTPKAVGSSISQHKTRFKKISYGIFTLPALAASGTPAASVSPGAAASRHARLAAIRAAAARSRVLAEDPVTRIETMAAQIQNEES